MKKLVALSYFYFLVISIFSQNSSIDITAYNIKADYDFSKQYINIIANVNIEKSINSTSFKLLFGSWISLHSVKSGNELISYSRNSPDDDTLSIKMPSQFKNDSKINLVFDYSLSLDSLNLKNIVLLRREVRWYPLLYDDMASMKLDVTAPDNFSVFFTGDLLKTITLKNNIEYQFANDENKSYALVMIKTDTFNTTFTKKINNVNIKFFIVSKDTVANNAFIKDVCNSFSFYNNFIGNYKLKELTLLEIPNETVQFVQSLSSLILFGQSSLTGYKAIYDWVPHEVAHQWWGSGLSIDSKSKCRWFLEESIDEYFHALFIQKIFGDENFNKQLSTYLYYYNYIDPDKKYSIIETNDVNSDENVYVIYKKGPLVINKLKNLMGKDNYQKFIQEIYKTYYGRMLNYEGFIKMLTKYDDAKGNFVSSLNKWLLEKGYSE